MRVLGREGITVVAVVLAVACGTSKHGFDDSDGGTSGSSGGGTFGDGGLSFDAGGDACTSFRCSIDLHNVVDCTGKVITACPADQGCANGGCVTACDSASANKAAIGCEYYAVAPDTGTLIGPPCFAAYVANTWTAPITIGVDRAGQSLNVGNFARIATGTGKNVTYATLPGGQLPPGQVAILFLAQTGLFVPCPVTPGYAGDPAIHGTTTGDTFHITTSAPVVAYDIFPYGGGAAELTSATLLLPTSVWDTNYIAVNAFTGANATINFPGAGPSLDIVAQADGTTVTILPVAPIAAGTGVDGTAANTPHTYGPLKKGEVLQFSQLQELTGSPIQSNFPIGMWAGSTLLNVDLNIMYADSAHQQIAPVKAWGSEYVGVRYRNRADTGPDETPPWRVVGAVDGTTLTYEPSTPTGAPATLGKGQVVRFDAAGPFVVKSQDADHPFYMAAYMTGCQTYFQDADCRGDPEFVNVVPAAQYLGSYTFFTDPTYPETDLVVVRTQAQDGTFKDVALDCAGTLGGWQPIDSAGKYQYTRTDLVRHNFAPQNGCDNGRHEMKSDAPFGVTVWGWGTAEATDLNTMYVSYAYPAGMGVQPVNTVVVPPTPK